MRTQFICLALVIILLGSYASAQWVRISGPDSCSIYCLTIRGTSLFAGTNKGVFLSTDTGGTWAAAGLGGWSVYSLAFIGPTLFAGANNGLFYSTDDGMSWRSPVKDLLILAVVQGGTALWLGTIEGVLISYSPTDSSKWYYYRVGLPANLTVESLFVNGDDVYAGAAGGGTIYRSKTNLGGWTAIDKNFPENSHVTCMGISGANLLAGFWSSWGTGMLYSNVSNVSWFVSNVLGHSPMSLVTSGRNAFAGTNLGVFLSTDEGVTWSSTNLRWPDGLEITVLSLVVIGTNLHAGTNGVGIWRRPLSEMIASVGLPLAELPAQFSLRQNYPNPFNPSTTIKYELPRASQVSLMVYDILGREVSTLVNERREAGVYEVKFEGSGLSSGLYFYRIRAGDFVETKRLMLIR